MMDCMVVAPFTLQLLKVFIESSEVLGSNVGLQLLSVGHTRWNVTWLQEFDMELGHPVTLLSSIRLGVG